jgi:osmotically inducible protein OsmC
MLRHASARWTGGLKDGRGTIDSPSGALKGIPYTWSMRFEDAPGTNPEELIAAAHAACFSMAFSSELGKAGMTPQSIETKASLTFEKTNVGFSITTIHLDSTAKVPGADRAKFLAAAEAAKKTCPVSRVLNANITLDAKLG